MSRINIKRLTGRERKKGDPDYRLSRSIDKNNWWQIDIYSYAYKVMVKRPDMELIRHYNRPLHDLNVDWDPLYHILESNGSPSIALLYKDFIDDPIHYNIVYRDPLYHNKKHKNNSMQWLYLTEMSRRDIDDFPFLSIGGLIAHLTKFIIYEPELLTWQ